MLEKRNRSVIVEGDHQNRLTDQRTLNSDSLEKFATSKSYSSVVGGTLAKNTARTAKPLR